MELISLYRFIFTFFCLFFAMFVEASKKEEHFPQRIFVQARLNPIPCDNDVKVQMKRTVFDKKEKIVSLYENVNLYHGQHIESQRLHSQNKSIQLIYTGEIFQIKGSSFQPLKKNALNFKAQDTLFDKQFIVQKDSFIEEHYVNHQTKNWYRNSSKGSSPERISPVHCYGGYYCPGKTSILDISQTYFMIAVKANEQNQTDPIIITMEKWRRLNIFPLGENFCCEEKFFLLTFPKKLPFH